MNDVVNSYKDLRVWQIGIDRAAETYRLTILTPIKVGQFKSVEFQG